MNNKFKKIAIISLIIIAFITITQLCNYESNRDNVLVTYVFEDSTKLVQSYIAKDRNDLNEQIDDYIENAISNKDIKTYPIAILVDESLIE